MAPLSDKTMTEPGHSVRIPWNSDTVELVSFGYVLVDNPQPLDEFQRELAEMDLSCRTGMTETKCAINLGRALIRSAKPAVLNESGRKKLLPALCALASNVFVVSRGQCAIQRTKQPPHGTVVQ